MTNPEDEARARREAEGDDVAQNSLQQWHKHRSESDQGLLNALVCAPHTEEGPPLLSHIGESVMKNNVREIMQFIGEDMTRPGLEETPARVVKSWKELFDGYEKKPAEYLEKRFPIKNSQMVSLNGINFFSFCEHHMLPFFGTADVTYIPQSEVCGLSKLVRVVDAFARRLQMQESLNDQVAQCIDEELAPLGVAVRMRAVHMCMAARGVQSHGSEMVTTSLRGKFLTDPAVKQEWLASLPV